MPELSHFSYSRLELYYRLEKALEADNQIIVRNIQWLLTLDEEQIKQVRNLREYLAGTIEHIELED